MEEATIKALMEKDGADYSTVTIATTGEVDSLIVIEQEADFAWIYYGWTGVEAELKGMELNFIQLREIDPALDYYTPVLVAGETLIEENRADPEIYAGHRQGYRFAAENPAEAAEALLANAPELTGSWSWPARSGSKIIPGRRAGGAFRSGSAGKATRNGFLSAA